WSAGTTTRPDSPTNWWTWPYTPPPCKNKYDPRPGGALGPFGFFTQTTQPMILIVDSGATKSDWIALDDKGEQLFLTQTLGLSPEVLTREVIEDRLANNFELSKNRDKVRLLYFYGAGCGTDRMKVFLRDIFKDFFPNAKADVKEDTYAAIHATTQIGRQAIVCILGTGSNCSYYDG